MSNYKKPQSILITGASSGMGADFARHYAAPGIYLALSGRNDKRLDTVIKECLDKGAAVQGKIIDVTDQKAMAQWIEKIDEENPLDLVIANAGISGGTGGNPDGEPVQQAREIFDINVTGVLNTINPVLPQMIKRKNGQVVLMSSLASFSGWPGAPAYSASKAAIRYYGEALRVSLSDKNIRVNVLCPGFVVTPMTAVNDYKMPFMITSEKAVRTMAQGIARNKGRIAFPIPTYLFATFLGILPRYIRGFLMNLLPEKPSKNT